MNFPKIDLQEYYYDLPEELIAQEPSKKRSGSRLLVYDEGKIEHGMFRDLPKKLDSNDLLIFNTSKVVNARLFLKRESGASIEVLLLNPVFPSHDPMICLGSNKGSTWNCMVGNKKKWKEKEELEKSIDGLRLVVRWEDREKNHVTFDWDGDQTFGELISSIGKLPLPPYLKHKPGEIDEKRYQTVYAREPGAVAAPTAGLHFSTLIIDELQGQGVDSGELVLHVGGGTFAPIKTDDPSEHDMHREYFEISRELLEKFLQDKGRRIIPVGTTSLRVLESLYWIGMLGGEQGFNSIVDKHTPYQHLGNLEPWEKALENIIDHMDKNGLDSFSGETGIFIVPGYSFRVANGLITNFHLPGTTLILLVAAMVGKDWKVIYDQAKREKYRFLSYGDSSLILP